MFECQTLMCFHRLEGQEISVWGIVDADRTTNPAI